jgi:hypothetical protein
MQLNDPFEEGRRERLDDDLAHSGWQSTRRRTNQSRSRNRSRSNTGRYACECRNKNGGCWRSRC